MKRFTLFTITVLFYCSGVLAQSIEEFFATENEYVKVLESHVTSLYEKKPNLVVIEFSVKRNPTGIESEKERYVYLKALDKNDITEISDEATKRAMESVGLELKEISIYNGVFKLPKSGLKPVVISVGNSRSPLNNKWAKLVQP